MALARAHADERLVRITMCAYRKKGISEKEFHHYWAEVHGPLAREWFHRCGIVKYVQVTHFLKFISQSRHLLIAVAP